MNYSKIKEFLEMKKFLVAIFATLLLFGGLSANAFGKKSADTLALVPTMNTETSAQNRIWVGTFQLAWNELMDNFAKGPVEFSKYKSLVLDELNAQSFKAADISENAYYAKFDKTSPELKKEIEEAIKAKFDEKSDILDSLDWSKGRGKYTAYAMLKKDFKFTKAFAKLKKESFGKNRTKVAYFGINKESDTDLGSMVNVLFYNNPNDFAAAIKTEGKDVVYLYRTNDNKTFDKLYADMMKKHEGYTDESEFTSKDELKVPNIDLYKMQAFKELENKKIKGTNFVIGTAVETVKFKIDNEGVKLKSEAAIMTKMTALRPEPTAPRKLYFTDTFVMFLQESDKNVPYFAMRVADVAALNKTAKK